MYLISYYIDSTDNAKEHTSQTKENLLYWIENMFPAYGSRLVVTSIILI